MRGGSLALLLELLEPRCSKFRGELTSFQAICSLELESLGVKPSPTWEALPFILQGGAPDLHISIVISWSARWVLRLRQSAGPARSVGSGEAVSGRFSWAMGCQDAVPSWSVGVALVLDKGSAVVLCPVHPYWRHTPSLRGF